MADPSPVQPAPAPTPTPRSSSLPTLLAAWAQSVLLAAVAGWFAHSYINPVPTAPEPPLAPPTPVHVNPPSAATSDFFRLGQAYRAPFLAAYGDAWIEQAGQLPSIQSVDQALAAVKADWDARRRAIFGQTVAPAFDKLTAGQQLDDATRTALKQAWQDFGQGLKSP